MKRKTVYARMALLLLAAAGLRLLLAIRVHVATLDTAVVGQMARNILTGDRPLFFAGQNYMGALEAYVLAAVFAVVPPNHTTMTLATIGFALAWVLATYWFFRKPFGPHAALAAAIIPALPGWTTIWYTTAPYGGYPQTYFFGMLLLLLATPFAPGQPPPPKPLRHALTLGLVAALAVWTNLQVLPYLAAVALAGLLAWIRNPRPLRPWLPYALVPACILAAFLPQRLAEPAHVYPPMFEAFSLSAISRSWRGLWSYDLAHCLLWSYPPRILHILMAILISGLLLGSIAMVTQPRFRADRTLRFHGVLVATMLAVFCLTYFPHPMSGFVPRYLVAPLTLLLSWASAVWVSQSRPLIRRPGIGILLALALYNTYGVWHVTQVRAPGKQETLQDFAAVIAAARTQDWMTIQHTGSETEGYDAARLTYTAGGNPVFTSAFGERFLAHQMAWETGVEPALLTRQNALPFLLGSYAALQADPGRIVACPPYALVENPPVQRWQESSVSPRGMTSPDGNINAHPLFDRSNQTTWPATEEFPQRISLAFDPPVQLSGLRVLARHPQELPYQYRLRTRQPGQDWQEVQISQQRIAASYLSGTRIYFRGFQPWMDIRCAPHPVDALEWIVEQGPANRTPPELNHLFVLATDQQPWPALDPCLSAILDALQEYPQSPLLAERGLLRELHRYGRTHAIDPAVAGRIPWPYNPRFSSTLPPQMPLPSTDCLLALEQGYATGAVQRLQAAGRTVREIAAVPPFVLYHLAPASIASLPLYWQGFTVVYE